MGNGRPVRPDQSEIFTGPVKLEIRVQLARLENHPVLARREYDQVSARIERHVREGPLLQIARIVGKMPALQVHDFIAGIVYFDPIGVVPVLVDKIRLVDGQEFADDQRRRIEHQPSFQRLEGQPFAAFPSLLPGASLVSPQSPQYIRYTFSRVQ